MLFAIFASIAAFGIGNMVQSNSVAEAVRATFNIPASFTGMILMVATGLVIIGGIKSIGKVTGFFVPVMIIFYICGAMLILTIHIAKLPTAFLLIFKEAFTPTVASGGFLGAGVMYTFRMGVARGVFSDESGLGSSPIAAAARTKNPATQALISMTQTFIDTIVVCKMMGLVLIVIGCWNNGKNGAELTSSAFSQGLPGEWGNIIVAVGLILFAYSTILCWCYYGEKSIEYLLGERIVRPYRIVYVLFVGIGALLKLNLVWALANVFNGLMAVPNLIGLLALSPVIFQETRNYFQNRPCEE
jgi:AGCS family alanine or glycine:cation symporter